MYADLIPNSPSQSKLYRIEEYFDKKNSVNKNKIVAVSRKSYKSLTIETVKSLTKKFFEYFMKTKDGKFKGL